MKLLQYYHIPIVPMELSMNKRIGKKWQELQKEVHKVKAIPLIPELSPIVLNKKQEYVIRYTFFRNNKRAIDLDGLISACKYFQDGIATQLEINDSQFTTLIAKKIYDKESDNNLIIEIFED